MPYECPPDPNGKADCWGSGVDTVLRMRRRGAVASLYSFPGAGHCPAADLSASPAADAMLGFLAEHLDLEHAECP